MVGKSVSLQDQFLNGVRRSKLPVTIFLLKGVKLQGVITWFDAFSLLLRREGSSQLVYKHAISTVVPGGPVPVDAMAPTKGAKPQLQDAFLAAAVREQQSMTVYLVNGVMLDGAVAAFDQFSLVLERGGRAQLVYKHAISTLQPAAPLNLDIEHSGQGEPHELI